MADLVIPQVEKDRLYLIAHKVRGKTFWDVAEKAPCHVCNSEQSDCGFCNGEGHWWIISTFGHRAYPFLTIEFATLESAVGEGYLDPASHVPPENLRDFYIIHERQVAATKARAKPATNDTLTLEDLGL